MNRPRPPFARRYDPALEGSYLGSCGGGGSLGFIARATKPIPLEVQAVAVAN